MLLTRKDENAPSVVGRSTIEDLDMKYGYLGHLNLHIKHIFLMERVMLDSE